jgi:glycosyl hydrolase family 35
MRGLAYTLAAVLACRLCRANRGAEWDQKPLIVKPAAPFDTYPQTVAPAKVSFDEHSLLINGKRTMIFSGEFHPWRLPVPSLWLDVFQKIKALGFNCVSFYVNWALLEGKPGNVTSDGVFDLELFLQAAADAGLYLIAVCEAQPRVTTNFTDSLNTAPWSLHQR